MAGCSRALRGPPGQRPGIWQRCPTLGGLALALGCCAAQGGLPAGAGLLFRAGAGIAAVPTRPPSACPRSRGVRSRARPLQGPSAALRRAGSQREPAPAPTPIGDNGPSGGGGDLLGLAVIGGVLGPAVDAIHNQALLSYEVLPVAVDLGLGVAQTSLLIPPLLAAAYVILGALLPPVSAQLVGDGRAPSLPLLRGLGPARRAALAVASTCLVIKLSELLAALGSAALLPLAAAAVLQWALLDGSYASLALASLAAVGGPLAEMPLMWAGAWHYTAPDYWPLAPFGFGEGSGAVWAGLSILTGPCYFAVTTDSIALGRWLRSGLRGG